jgi:GSCFA family
VERKDGPGRSGPPGDPARWLRHDRGLEADRAQHLAAVRKAFEELAVFVFTLGLTECWTSRADGTAFPLAPGVAGGVFDPDRYELINLTVADVERDLTAFVGALLGVNPPRR